MTNTAKALCAMNLLAALMMLTALTPKAMDQTIKMQIEETPATMLRLKRA